MVNNLDFDVTNNVANNFVEFVKVVPNSLLSVPLFKAVAKIQINVARKLQVKVLCLDNI